jgi:hypothetical protein
MAATYPDIFAAIGSFGARLRRGRDMPSAFAAMGGGTTIRPRGEGWTVPTIVFHGDTDRTVNPVNSDLAQARQEAALTKTVTHDETPGGMAYMSLLHRRGVATFPQREVPGYAGPSKVSPSRPHAFRRALRNLIVTGHVSRGSPHFGYFRNLNV